MSEEEKDQMLNRWLALAWGVMALALIGWGLFLVYPPACPIGIGLLLWHYVAYGPDPIGAFDSGKKSAADKKDGGN